MKKRVLSITLAAALALQMLPLPTGCLSEKFGFRISKAAEAFRGTMGENQNTNYFSHVKGANPMEAADMFCELSVDKNNQLSGTIEVYVVWSSEAAADVEVTTKVKDEKGNLIAEQEIKKTLTPGMQKVHVVFDKVKAELGGLSGDFKAVCEMILVDSEKNEIHISQPGITVKNVQLLPDPGVDIPGIAATPTPVPAVTPTPAASQTPDVTVSPTPTPGGIITPAPTPGEIVTPVPTPEETVTPVPTPEETITPVPTPEEIVTPAPTPDVTPKPVQTERPKPDPTKKPAAPEKVSAPKKGDILTAGSLTYIVRLSSEEERTAVVYAPAKNNVKKVVIPKKVKLKGYTFTVTGVRKNAFTNMPKLTEVEIGKNVKRIGKNAFKNCKNLEFLIIAENLVTIEPRAFAGCTKLNRILVKSNKIKAVGENAFQGITSKAIVKTPESKWREYLKKFMNTGKMSQNALFVINPVKLNYKGRLY